MQLKPSGNTRPSLLIADCGHIIQLPGAQLMILNTVTRYEGNALLRDFRITNFTQYNALFEQRSIAAEHRKTEQMNMHQLWRSSEPAARAELHWRITLVLSVFIMALIIVPLSLVNDQQKKMLSMLPAMLLYLFFFLLQTSLHSNGVRGKINPMFWIWLTNTLYLGLALVLNLGDSFLACRLRSILFYVKKTF